MKVLAIDTATEACSVALLNEGNVHESYVVEQNRHSALLLAMIDSLLKDHKLELSDLDALAYDHGPGSFTGVRIGAGVVQGLSIAHSLPVIGVSSLGILAEMIPGRLILPAIDARMGQVYWSLFARKDTTVEQIIAERVDGPEDVLEQLTAQDDSFSDLSAIGSGWLRYAALESFLEALPDSSYGDDPYPRAVALVDWLVRECRDQSLEDLARDSENPLYVRNDVAHKKLQQG